MTVDLCVIGYFVVAFIVAVGVEIHIENSSISMFAGVIWPLFLLCWLTAAPVILASWLVDKTAELVKRLLSGKTGKGPVNLRKSS